MEEIHKLRIINKLKSVYRECSVENRKESSAEHSWSALIIADYFLSVINEKLDRLKVYELLMYHDLVEIESGNFEMAPGSDRSKKYEIEEIASKKLSSKLPEIIKNKFIKLFNEFEEQKTRESKFAKAIDYLDAEIHELDYIEDWKGWTEEHLRNKKEKYYAEFPELKEVFEKMISFLKKEGYFDQ